MWISARSPRPHEGRRRDVDACVAGRGRHLQPARTAGCSLRRRWPGRSGHLGPVQPLPPRSTDREDRHPGDQLERPRRISDVADRVDLCPARARRARRGPRAGGRRASGTGPPGPRGGERARVNAAPRHEEQPGESHPRAIGAQRGRFKRSIRPLKRLGRREARRMPGLSKEHSPVRARVLATSSRPCRACRHRACAPAAVLLGRLGDDRLGGEDVLRDRRGVLQRRAGDHGRVDDAGCDQVAVLAVGRVQALAGLQAADLARPRPEPSRPEFSAIWRIGSSSERWMIAAPVRSSSSS